MQVSLTRKKSPHKWKQLIDRQITCTYRYKLTMYVQVHLLPQVNYYSLYGCKCFLAFTHTHTLSCDFYWGQVFFSPLLTISSGGREWIVDRFRYCYTYCTFTFFFILTYLVSNNSCKSTAADQIAIACSLFMCFFRLFFSSLFPSHTLAILSVALMHCLVTVATFSSSSSSVYCFSVVHV